MQRARIPRLFPSGSISESQPDSWWSGSNSLTRIMGFSILATFFSAITGNSNLGGGSQSSYAMDSIRLFMLGAVVEGGRRLFAWVIQRFKLFQYSITAQFQEGDPAFEWITLLLTEERIWTRSRQFSVTASSSLRKWSVNVSNIGKSTGALKSISGSRPGAVADEHAEYVPTYEEPQLFRWRGYWTEVRRSSAGSVNAQAFVHNNMVSMGGRLYLTIYTRDMSVLSAFVEDARRRYVNNSRPHVIVHSVDQTNYGPGATWTNAKRKTRRPLSSIILQEGVIQSLVDDAKEFFKMEDWYIKAGIPHRRGYLLHGPPGTGKSSTIYAVAGELGLEIYSLSLSSSFIDDAFLQRAISSIPKQAIFLIEDIDCAFPPRDADDDVVETVRSPQAYMSGFGVPMYPPGTKGRSLVTLSGLLNALDGVASEEGKIFFATTNHVDQLDPALLRPGRIDRKIQYKLATKAQAAALFMRFYPESYTILPSELSNSDSPSPNSEKNIYVEFSSSEKLEELTALSLEFASHIPEHEFSTAELQGFLLYCKQEPLKAVRDVSAWVETERKEREERIKREEERNQKKNEKKEAKERQALRGGLARLGIPVPDGKGGPGGKGFMAPHGKFPVGNAQNIPPIVDALANEEPQKAVEVSNSELRTVTPSDSTSSGYEMVDDPTNKHKSDEGVQTTEKLE